MEWIPYHHQVITGLSRRDASSEDLQCVLKGQKLLLSVDAGTICYPSLCILLFAAENNTMHNPENRYVHA